MTSLARLSKRTQATLYMFAIGAIILVLSGWLWWSKVSVNPQRVFSAMLSQSLSTQGVTVNVAQVNSNQSVADQYIQFQLGGVNMAHAVSVLSQNTTIVHTETIGTPNTDYSRYTSIQTSQKNKNGQAIDFSKVLNVWSKTPTSQSAQSSFLSQAILGVELPLGSIPVPIGNVNPDQRAALLKEIRNDRVYDIDYSKVKKQTRQGRLLYTYSVKMQPVTYVHLMQQFAKAVGLHDLDSVDPDSYSGSQPFTMQLTVDAHSTHLVSASAPSGFGVSYTGYDLPVTIKEPTNAISNTELQRRLSEL
jgi:hypothetical protein